MATRNRTKAKTGPVLAPAGVDDSFSESIAGLAEIGLPEGLLEPEEWENFFGPPEGGAVVHVRRLAPEKWPHPVYNIDVTTKGFLDLLPYGVDVEPYIANRWGGGLYLVSLLENHRYKQNRRIEIPGPPIIEDKNLPGTNGVNGSARVKQDARTALSEPVTVEGIPVGLPPGQFSEMLQQVMILKSVLRESQPAAPQDINAALLSYLLKDREQSNPLSQVTQLIELQGAIASMQPSGGTGANLTDLLLAGLQTLPKILASAGARTALAASKPPAALPELAAPESPPAAPNGALDDPDKPSQIEDNMSINDIVRAAVDDIVGSFLQIPRYEVPRVVALLDLGLPLVPEVRAQLVSMKGSFVDMGQLELDNRVDLDDNGKAEFARYFSQVFDAYVAEQRPAPLPVESGTDGLTD